MFVPEVVALFEELRSLLRLVHAWAYASRMGTVLQNIFGKGKNNYGDVEFWHGAERAGWLMKQGGLSAPPLAAPAHASVAHAEASVAGVAGEYIKTWRRRQGARSTNWPVVH